MGPGTGEPGPWSFSDGAISRAVRLAEAGQWNGRGWAAGGQQGGQLGHVAEDVEGVYGIGVAVAVGVIKKRRWGTDKAG